MSQIIASLDRAATNVVKVGENATKIAEIASETGI